MSFSTPLFLSLLLPAAVLAYVCANQWLRRPLLLVFSLAFYAWCDWRALPVLIGLSVGTFLVAVLVDKLRGRWHKPILALGVVGCLSVLVFCKYWGFCTEAVGPLALRLGVRLPVLELLLPVGLSFYVFQAVSFLIDVSRGSYKELPGFWRFMLYMAFFPKMVCGPIARYGDMAADFGRAEVDLGRFSSGCRRFAVGLVKKILIADVLGQIVDPIFAAPVSSVPCVYCWWGSIAYTLQIYFDFSGCTDMALGLAQIFNFALPENFNFPYVATSIQDFWRRWHISLSTWFRDYLYIPLGGNRKGTIRTYLNLCIVFLVCGLWHGASWTFVAWGAYHGVGLVVERLGVKRLLDRLPGWLSRLYVVFFVMIGWVLFRSPDISSAIAYLGNMFFGNGKAPYWSFTSAYMFFDLSGLLTLGAAAVLAHPAPRAFFQRLPTCLRNGLLLSAFAVAYVFAMTGNSAPSIYAQF